MLNHKKGIALALCGLMSFSVASTTLIAPAYAASHHADHQADMQKPHDEDFDHQAPPPEYAKRAPKPHQDKDDPMDYEEHRSMNGLEVQELSHRRGKSQGDVNTAYIVGAVLGAVIAKNT